VDIRLATDVFVPPVTNESFLAVGFVPFDPIWPPLSLVITVNSGVRHREFAIKPRKLPRSLRYFLVYPLFWSLSFLTILSFLNIWNKAWVITLNNFMERPPSWEAYSRLTVPESAPPHSTWRFIVIPTVSHHWTIFWSRCIQSAPQNSLLIPRTPGSPIWSHFFMSYN
jgi:hypothetical protein